MNLYVLFRWVPVYADEKQLLSCMSIGFLLNSKNDSVVWRGPKKNGNIYIIVIITIK